MSSTENIIPEAGNLYSALRNSGYSNIAAIGDLIDNSLDAGAKTIRIEIADDLKQIFLSDDGTGMSPETLNQALKLGGRKEHDRINDLGKYGLGLITASISIGTRFRVITKRDGVISVGAFDVDEVYDSNRFIASFREANEAEVNSFNFRTNNANSGTVIIIENCDKIQYSNKDDFVGELKDYIKTAFWSFISDGKEIYIDDNLVPADDPLFRFDKRTEVIVDKTVDIPMSDGGTEKLEIVAVLIPDFDKNLKRSMRINIETQGFYVLRNNREIAPAVEIIEVFKKHNDFNRLRIKLNFGPGLDEEMGVNYTKHNISPKKRIINILQGELSEKLRKVRRELKDGQKPDKPQEPKNPFSEPEPKKQQMSQDTTPSPEPKDDKADSSIKAVTVKTRFSSEKDSLVSVSKSEDDVSIWVNGANKFYKNAITDKENGSELKKYFDTILKAFIEASVKNNVPVDTIETIVKDISSALEGSEF